MAAENSLWNSPPREKQVHADKERLERETDASLVRAVAHYDPNAISEELKKYEINPSELKSFAILLS